MVGEANETEVVVEQIHCRALLDTGSTISTISEQFYHDNFSGFQSHPLADFLKVECTGGQLLPYLGYIAAEIGVPELGLKGCQSFILLVVSDTDYNARVPLLIGTNVLRQLSDSCRSEAGSKFMQKIAQLTPWWLAFRCISLEEKAVSCSKGKLGLVKCASADTLRIPGNSVVAIPGFIGDAIPCMRLAMLHPTSRSLLPDGVEVTPTLVSYTKNSSKVEVEIANSTNQTILVQPRSLLCKLQQVDIVDEMVDNVAQGTEDADLKFSPSSVEREEFFRLFSIEEVLTPDQLSQVQDLLLRYGDVFSMGDFDIGRTKTVRHWIDLTDDVPFKQRHRRIPPSMYEEVKAHLQQLLESGMIVESSSPWASGIVLVRKKDGRLRFCIDYRQFNQRTVRDSYALPRIDEMIDHLLGAKYFSSLDMRSGYYQVEMEEAHKPLTAFTVGPLGFYQCERMPFGLTNAPATFQRLMEIWVSCI